MPRPKVPFYKSRRWRSVRWAALRRDKMRCQRCGVHKRYGQGLTVHHIIPRNEGGGHHLANLISLCPECHDLAEIKGWRTKLDICWIELKPDIEAPTIIAGREIRDWRDIDWRIMVYGGVKDFEKAKKIMAEKEKLGMYLHCPDFKGGSS